MDAKRKLLTSVLLSTLIGVGAGAVGAAESFAGINQGLAMDTGVRPYWTLHNSILQIKPGMTKAEVQKLVGNPIMVFNFPRLQEEAWLYEYLEGQIRMKSWVHFTSPDGRVKYHTQEYDSSYYSGG